MTIKEKVLTVCGCYHRIPGPVTCHKTYPGGNILIVQCPRNKPELYVSSFSEPDPS